MIAMRDGTETYASVWQRTVECLSPLGVVELPSGTDGLFAEANPGRVKLSIARWRIGAPNEALAECRCVRVSGAANDALITLIFPDDPERMPVFTAELLATNGRPELAWIDLRAAGLHAAIRDEVSEQTTVLSIRHAPFLPRNEQPPSWAIDYSPGGFLFTRTDKPDAVPRLVQAYEDYLNIWIDFAFGTTPGGRPSPDAWAKLTAFKQHCIAHAACRSSLIKWLGAERSHRLLVNCLFQ